MKKRYYSLYQNAETKTADIYIYGDITSWPWFEDEVSSYTLAKELEGLEDVENINIYINSYGGEVAEGLAIYNALKRHKARVTTVVDGFACSIASVIFAAGDERIMSNTSLLMIHNAWSYTWGDANELRKDADDLEKITQASINAYMNIVNVEEKEIKEMMDQETWLNGPECLEMGFASKLIEVEEKEVATQSIRESLMKKVKNEDGTPIEINYNISREELQELIQKELESQTLSTNEILAPIEPKETNKPINMMRALFNFKEDE